MMQVRFDGFSPLLRGFPRPIGHIGVLATHMFHDPVHDADIVLNFASTRQMTRSFRTLIRIEQELRRHSR
jgi:D-alanyl-D-alanine carboxypeptidase